MTKEKKCKGETEVFSRVTGFFAPVKGYNKGKKAEFKERKKFDKSATTIGKDNNETKVQGV